MLAPRGIASEDHRGELHATLCGSDVLQGCRGSKKRYSAKKDLLPLRSKYRLSISSYQMRLSLARAQVHCSGHGTRNRVGVGVVSSVCVCCDNHSPLSML